MTPPAGESAGPKPIDRVAGGVGWIAHPEETMQRASHAVAGDDGLWLVDPVDAPGLDDLLAEHGEVEGVAVTLDRHTRDAASIATRHDVPVWLPEAFDGRGKLPDRTPIARFGNELGESGLESHTVVESRFWNEVALYDPDRGVLIVPESVGTAPYFLAGDERLGVHPMRRAVPPRAALGRFVGNVETVLVGHGAGVTSGASWALSDALSGARARIPRLCAETLWGMAR
ncbi:hypothetical protein [Saliphagus sp. LR7]|uniref:hypothetical protein n=1 Tax=Saliphagus sp. LR7 TaxID=2282654 RepID=UPI000DF74AB1|nr:hypothetical protein [Saliphagus sp. LR7]